jgi:IS5 family transposase
MKGQTLTQGQFSFMEPHLYNLCNPNHPLFLLAEQIPWDLFEKEFAPLYSTKGQPAKPIRLMVGLLILKQLDDLSDERVVEKWVENPYFQYFTGGRKFE